jgi:hypothetical protein
MTDDVFNEPFKISTFSGGFGLSVIDVQHDTQETQDSYKHERIIIILPNIL